ncbi:ABC transporter permease [Christensenella intestinihominis]|uniref:ABC transporter permease n=1 Tax=Christensenella intestinihominis TaxID=1851429 RepID=UPI0008324D55|nr:ABC transporter permease [Christensenella intestinihominis]
MKIFRNVGSFVADVFKNRRLVLALTKKDVKRRYAGAIFGNMWSFVTPLLQIIVYWFVFGFVFNSGPVEGAPYALWFICGIVPWLFISEAISSSSNSFTEYSYLVKKVIFNVNILPLVKIFSSMFVHVCFMILVFVVALIMGYFPTVYTIQLIYYMFCSIMLLFAIGLIFSSIMVFFRDMNQLIGIFLMVGMWMTPIAWQASILKGYAWIENLNPFFYIIEGYRDSLLSRAWFFEHGEVTLYFWVFTGVLFVIGITIYNKLKPHFADVL